MRARHQRSRRWGRRYSPSLVRVGRAVDAEQFPTDGAGFSEFRLLDHALVRVAAWPVETLDEFAATALCEAASRVLALTAEIEQRAPALVAVLHECVPRVSDRAARAFLLDAKRRIHAGTTTLLPPLSRVERLLPSEILAALRAEADRRQELALARAAFADLYAEEVRRQRECFRRLTRNATFRRALELGNPVLAERWESVRDN